jgi:hypothetical protein
MRKTNHPIALAVQQAPSAGECTIRLSTNRGNPSLQSQKGRLTAECTPILIGFIGSFNTVQDTSGEPLREQAGTIGKAGVTILPQ